MLDGPADSRMVSRDEDYQIQCFSCEKWLSTKQVQVSLEYVPINASVFFVALSRDRLAEITPSLPPSLPVAVSCPT